MSLLFFVDESADADVHLHLGVLADGAQVAAATIELDEIVRQAHSHGLVARIDAELHGEPMFHMHDEWEPGKNNIDGAIAVYDSALDVLARHGIEVITRGVKLGEFRARYPQGRSPHPQLFVHTCERLNERLKVRKEFGLIIADQQQQHADEMRSLLTEGQRRGTGGYRSQTLTRIVDTVHFVDSKQSRMTQLADLCAFIHRRRISGVDVDPRAIAVVDRLAGKVLAAVPSPDWQYATIWVP